jgi:signal transduction histidine kinase
VTSAPSPVERVSAWYRSLDPRLVDAVVGTVFTVISVVSVLNVGDPELGYADPGVLAVILALVFGSAFYVRRSAPLVCTLVAATALVLIATLDYQSNAQSQMLLVAMYALGSYESGVRRVVGFVGVEVGVAIVAIVGIPEASTGNLMFAGALYAAVFFIGVAMRNRRLYQEQLEQRADLLAREHQEAAARAIADERLRIAQELHDVVAHSMGVIAVQAGVGSHVIETDPAEAKRSLDAISVTSRTTLAEIRRLLGVLRSDGDGAAYAPAPGLADLDRLVADIRAAGVGVDIVTEGTPHEVPPGVDLTAYRIVQEALTNVLKHAGPARAAVTVGYEPDAITLEVVDDGRGINGRATEGGHGLLGMRERVAVYGGTLDAGPRVGGGFRVAARLPYGAEG